MSDSNQYDWTKPIMRGTFSPSHGLVSAPASPLSSCAPSGYVGEVTEEWIIPGIGPVQPVPPLAASQSDLSQVVKEEWIISGIGPVTPSGPTADPADTPSEAPSSSTSAPKSYSKPEWASPIDEGFIHPEGYTTKIVGINFDLPSRLADAQSPPHVAHRSITIPMPKGDVKLDTTSHGVKTPPPTPGPPPNTPSKQAGVKTPPPTPGPPPNTPSQRSIGTQTCIKATHLPVYLPPPNCAYPTNRTDQFVDDVEVVTGGSFEPGPSHTKEPKRLPFHRRPTQANVLDLVQKIKVLEHIVRELVLRKDGTPPPVPSVSSNTPSKQAGVTETAGKTPAPSPDPPPNSPSKNLSKDGTPPPPPSSPPNTPAKRAEEGADFSKDGTLPPPPSSPPPNTPSEKLSKEGTPPPPPSVPPNTAPKRVTLITDFFSKVVKDPSPRLPPSPLPNTSSKELDKGGGGVGETPPPNFPTELSKNGTPPPPLSPPPNTPSKKLSKGGGTPSPPPSSPPNTPVKRLSRPGTRRLSLVIPDGHRELYYPTNQKPIAEGGHRPSLVDYTSDGEYPSPDPGSGSPITPLWLEMKDMVDKFIFKTEEEEENRNIAKRSEAIPLPPSKLNSPVTPDPRLSPRMLASLMNATIPVRMDEQGRVRVEQKPGAGARDGGRGEASLQPLDTTEAELNASIADEVQKMVRHLTAWEEGAVATGEIETAWERGRKALMRRDAAVMQAARDAWEDEDHQNTPQVIGSLSYIHPDSIKYRLNSPKVVGKHVKTNEEIRETVTYFSKEK